MHALPVSFELQVAMEERVLRGRRPAMCDCLLQQLRARDPDQTGWYRNERRDPRFQVQLPGRRPGRVRRLQPAETEQRDLRVYRTLSHRDSPAFPEERWSMSTIFPAGPVFRRASLPACTVSFERQLRWTSTRPTPWRSYK